MSCGPPVVVLMIRSFGTGPGGNSRDPVPRTTNTNPSLADPESRGPQPVFAAMSGREAPFIFFTGLSEDLSDRWP